MRAEFLLPRAFEVDRVEQHAGTLGAELVENLLNVALGLLLDPAVDCGEVAPKNLGLVPLADVIEVGLIVRQWIPVLAD